MLRSFRTSVTMFWIFSLMPTPRISYDLHFGVALSLVTSPGRDTTTWSLPSDVVTTSTFGRGRSAMFGVVIVGVMRMRRLTFVALQQLHPLGRLVVFDGVLHTQQS